jgi:hypothetical protein
VPPELRECEAILLEDHESDYYPTWYQYCGRRHREDYEIPNNNHTIEQYVTLTVLGSLEYSDIHTLIPSLNSNPNHFIFRQI